MVHGPDGLAKLLPEVPVQGEVVELCEGHCGVEELIVGCENKLYINITAVSVGS